MSTSVVQIRFEQAELEYLRAGGMNPNEFARQRFDEALNALHALDRAQTTRRHRMRFAKPPAEIVRGDRESH